MTNLAHTQDQLIQAQKMEAVGRLAGGIAHDFNNLLTVIMGRADLVLSRLRGRDQLRRHVGLILSAADTAASLTRQLLAFSRRQVLQLAVIDLNLVVVNVSTMLRWLIGEDIEVIIRLSPGIGSYQGGSWTTGTGPDESGGQCSRCDAAWRTSDHRNCQRRAG